MGCQPPEPPALSGPLAPDEELVRVETVVSCPGPEDAVFDRTSRRYTGCADGTVLGSLHSPGGGVFGLISATPHDGTLYLDTLLGERVVRYPLRSPAGVWPPSDARLTGSFLRGS